MARLGSQSALTYVGVVAAVIGAIGFVAFGWRFGGDSGTVPTAVGVAFAAVAIVWTLYRRS
ncbi:hypothetical protein G9464_03165 [Halostella sp. JP-L12]|uniref:hypothetical protein n=1 Tax=Halostella TaxID=1843185 RepID=UPI000EF7941B|nr:MULTISPECIES: hypothetical protein [Halostella]NHN46597.1 hypothetical protein [Halostella sp. JP-L12]